MTYQPAIYKKQGSTEMVFASGAVLNFQSASLTSGGVLTRPVGMQIKDTVQATTGGALTPGGISRVRSTGGNAMYTIEPVAGLLKVIYPSTDSTGTAIVTTTGTFDGTNKNILFSSGPTNMNPVLLFAISSARWLVLNVQSTFYTTGLVDITNT